MKNRFICFVLLLVVSAFSGAQITVAQNTPAQSLASSARTERARNSDNAKPAVTGEAIEGDLAEALTVIQDNYIDGRSLDYNELFKSSIESMLHTLDPHSNYFDAKEFEQFRTEQRSEYFGIGATIGDLRQGEEVSTFIRATFEGSPAHRAGLRYGDKIVDVNGVSMRNKTFVEVRNNLRGPRGTTAKVTVQRFATGETRTFDIVRDAVGQPSIPEAYMIRPGVGYIQMSGGFNQTTGNEFVAALTELKAAGMKQLVLDLRNNGGGLVIQAYRIASAFLPEGQTIFSQKGRIRGTVQNYTSENPNPDQTPLVVLVNRNSASASEILAGALQDHDRALIVGEATFGKGLVQNPFQLPHGSALLLTIAKYQTPSGRTIQRDYSNGGLYDYYTNGGIGNRDKPRQPPVGAESRTDSGRIVYGGGGIAPDVTVKPALISPTQARLTDSLFEFALELASGKVAGFENYRVNQAIEFGHDIKAADFPVTDGVFTAYKRFVAANQNHKALLPVLDKEREYIGRQIRFELATAAYGIPAAFQVYNEADTQLVRGIELLPKAGELAQINQRKQVSKQ